MLTFQKYSNGPKCEPLEETDTANSDETDTVENNDTEEEDVTNSDETGALEGNDQEEADVANSDQTDETENDNQEETVASSDETDTIENTDQEVTDDITSDEPGSIESGDQDFLLDMEDSVEPDDVNPETATYNDEGYSFIEQVAEQADDKPEDDTPDADVDDETPESDVTDEDVNIWGVFGTASAAMGLRHLGIGTAVFIPIFQFAI